MRRTLPVLLVALVVAGCGRHYTAPKTAPPPKPQPPAVVAKQWLRATNQRLVGVGGRLFAKGARVPEGTLANQTRAGTWVQAVACTGRLVEETVRGQTVTLTLVSRQGPNKYCAKPGKKFKVVMRVVHGKIVSLDYR